MAAYAPSNAIIISDIAANIDRIREIIQSMDQSAVQQTEIVSLQYAVAEDVVRMLLELAKTAGHIRAGDIVAVLGGSTATVGSTAVRGARASYRT